MKGLPRATLVLTTYEMPRHLEMVFAALSRQSFQDFELIVCDDGSGEETVNVIENFIRESPVPVQHVHQEHQGFRKCRILNEGLRRARGETMVFLDGDCVPHRDYMRDHVENQERGRYLAGRRVNLGEKLSATLTVEQVRAGYFDWPKPSLLLSHLSGETTHLQRSFRVGPEWLRQVLRMNRIDDLVGCNYSVACEHLLAINGFDETYEGYGREDTDVEIRLQHLGLTIKSVKGLAIQFHIWHPRRAFTPANDDRLEEVRLSKRVRCEKGLLQ